MWFWAFLYHVYRLVLPGGGGLSLSTLVDAVKQTLVLNQEFHFYYLHILLLVYVFLPVTRTFVKNASRRELAYFLAVWFVVGILFPLIKGFWPFSLVYAISSQYTLNYTYASIGYGVLGHYLRQYGASISRRWYALALALGLAVTFGGAAVLSLSAGQLSELFFQGWSPGPMLMAAGIFGLLLSVKNWPEPLRRSTGWLSRASFCIYLIHVFFLYLLKSLGVTASAGLTWLTIPGVTLLILALSALVYEALRRIPFVKTYLI
jgi:surface polysaccharide O-acyltransferase-like enzyme